MEDIKKITDIFLGGNNKEELIDKIRRVTAENKTRLQRESEERIKKAIEKDTPKYLVHCLTQIVKNVELGRSEVTTNKYWPKHKLDWREQTIVGDKVLWNVIHALREKGFEAYDTSATEPKNSYGNGINIRWE